jgi:HIRAN domain-containing protein
MQSAGFSSSDRIRVWLERAGAGFRLRDAATEEPIRDDDPRVRVIKVAGVSYRLEALQDEMFAPGRRLALVPEPENEHDPHAIAIWDFEHRRQAGYVPAEVARDLDAANWQAVSLREFFEDGRRAGLRVLLAPKDAWVGLPRA